MTICRACRTLAPGPTHHYIRQKRTTLGGVEAALLAAGAVERAATVRAIRLRRRRIGLATAEEVAEVVAAFTAEAGA